MSHWDERSEVNLLAASEEESSFAAALHEWTYTGKVTDHRFPTQECELCEHPNLRYHYEVRNGVNGNVLQVGSECIKKFDITVLDAEGNRLRGEEVDAKLKEDLAAIQEKAREKMRLQPLRELYRTEGAEGETIVAYVDRYKEKGAFAPAHLAYLLEQMRSANIDFPSSLYPVRLRSNEEKRQLVGLTDEQRKLVWPCLQPNQIEIYEREKEKAEAEKARQREREAKEEARREWLAAQTAARQQARLEAEKARQARQAFISSPEDAPPEDVPKKRIVPREPLEYPPHDTELKPGVHRYVVITYSSGGGVWGRYYCSELESAQRLLKLKLGEPFLGYGARAEIRKLESGRIVETGVK